MMQPTPSTGAEAEKPAVPAWLRFRWLLLVPIGLGVALVALGFTPRIAGRRLEPGEMPYPVVFDVIVVLGLLTALFGPIAAYICLIIREMRGL